jgi:predicted site-specific integrase-resolvase
LETQKTGTEAQPQFVKAAEVASHLGVCRKTIGNYIRTGKISALKFGAYLIPLEEMQKLRPEVRK